MEPVKQKERILTKNEVRLVYCIFAALIIGGCWIGQTLGSKNPRPSRSSCLSNMKQSVLSAIMYGSDNEDSYPPFFTFESNKSRDDYLAVIFPYSKNKDIVICPADRFPDKGLEFMVGMEGDPKVMSYVHCLVLKGLIPNYSTGNRVLRDKDLAEPAVVPYLRDPIRGYGIDKDGTTTGFLSPHGKMFCTGFIDGHAKFRGPVNINTDL